MIDKKKIEQATKLIIEAIGTFLLSKNIATAKNIINKEEILTIVIFSHFFIMSVQQQGFSYK